MRLQMRLFKIEEKPVKAKLEVELKQEEEAKIQEQATEQPKTVVNIDDEEDETPYVPEEELIK